MVLSRNFITHGLNFKLNVFSFVSLLLYIYIYIYIYIYFNTNRIGFFKTFLKVHSLLILFSSKSQETKAPRFVFPNPKLPHSLYALSVSLSLSLSLSIYIYIYLFYPTPFSLIIFHLQAAVPFFLFFFFKP
jgi:hypothetical protein